MRDQKLALWAIALSLLFHLLLVYYSRHVTIFVGSPSESIEMFVSFDERDFDEYKERIVKREKTPPESIDKQDPADPEKISENTIKDPVVDDIKEIFGAPSELDTQLSPQAPPVEIMTAKGPGQKKLIESFSGPVGPGLGAVNVGPGKNPKGITAPPKFVAPPQPVGLPVPPTLQGARIPSPAGNDPIIRKEEEPVALPPVKLPDEKRIKLAKDELKTIENKEYVDIEQYLDCSMQTWHNKSGQGYFRILIKPNKKALELPVLRKDVVFALDASTSMGSTTMRELRKGIEYCILKLRPEDRFNLIGFETKVTRFTDVLAPANEGNKTAAIRMLSRFRNSGRTDIYSSLVPISLLGGKKNHPFVILLFSDGRPTMGEQNSRKIINDMTTNIAINSSVFALGAGSSRKKINRYLLDLIASRNKGTATFASDYKDVLWHVQEFYKKVSDPLMINVDYLFSGNVGNKTLPTRLPDLYRDGSLEFVGLMGEEREVKIYITGQFSDTRRQATFTLVYPQEDNGTPQVATRYGYHKIYELISIMCAEGETPERLRQLRELSKRYRIPVPYYNIQE
jgi:von Willebrand factor type A domain